MNKRMKYKNHRDGRKSDTMRVSEAMSDLLKEFKIEDKYVESQLIDSWEKVMGTPIATRTSKIYINQKVLFVHLTSAPLRQELEMSKDRVLDLLEKEMGSRVVDKVVFR